MTAQENLSGNEIGGASGSALSVPKTLLTPIGVAVTAVFAGVYQHSFASNANTAVAFK